MKTRYNRGWMELKRQAIGKKLFRRASFVGVAIVVIAGLAAIALSGCATTIAVTNPLVEVGDHATIKGLVRVAQMGEDCHSAEEALKEAIAGQFTNARLPAPSSVEVQTLAGSSFCGFSQGTASEVTTLELGARNTAVAEATVYWRYIVAADLRKAEAVLATMRPLAPRNLGAKLR